MIVWPWRRATLGLALCAALLLPGAARGQIYEVEGLRLGMSILAAQQVHPTLRAEEVPYVDERIGTSYTITFGRIAILRHRGTLLIEPTATRTAQLEYLFTGAGDLFAVQARTRDRGRSCAATIAALTAAYGRPIIEESPNYALWRQVVVLGPELELRCLDNPRGLYVLVLQQQQLQTEYLRGLFRRLRPAIEAAIQFLQ